MLPQLARTASFASVSVVATIGCAALCASVVRKVHGAPLTRAESWTLGLGLALAIASLVALALSALGQLMGWSFAGTCVVLAVAIDRLAPASGPVLPPRPAGRLLLMLALGGLALRAVPMENALGGRDPGTYTLRTQQTLRSGDLTYQDEVLAWASTEHQRQPRATLEDLLGNYLPDESTGRRDRYEAAYRPGFYLADRETGRLLGAELCAPAGEHLAHLIALAIDREMTAKALGFDRPAANSLDAVSDRDFALEFLSVASIWNLATFPIWHRRKA